jgi:hypothetical protein
LRLVCGPAPFVAARGRRVASQLPQRVFKIEARAA